MRIVAASSFLRSRFDVFVCVCLCVLCYVLCFGGDVGGDVVGFVVVVVCVLSCRCFLLDFMSMWVGWMFWCWLF